ncbi:50S ribosomal protein L25/general stress protein Ctc [Thermostilla marina]
MSETLHVEVRNVFGKRNARRLRARGLIPANLYGHKQECVALSVPASEMEAAVRHGSRMVRLDGGVQEDAVIREVQWDTWGLEILHVDFLRVSKGESVEVTVPIEIRGEAPGVKEGGVLKVHLHELEMACPATSIPEKVVVKVNNLEIGQHITIGDLALPEGAKVDIDPSTAVVSCDAAGEAAEEEEEAAETGAAEPELIGRKKEEDEQGDQ